MGIGSFIGNTNQPKNIGKGSSMSALNKSQHAGAEWIVKALKTEISPFGARVADLLGYAFDGIYHLEDKALAKVDWTSPSYIKFHLYAKGGLATYDFGTLTKLVFLAHEFCVRLSIKPCNMQHVYLIFSPRQREGDFSQYHPTITAASDKFLVDFGGFNFVDGNWMAEAWERIASESKT
jgi:hypothetical protein